MVFARRIGRAAGWPSVSASARRYPEGSPQEIKAVRNIYRAFVEDGKTESEIAAQLNAHGILTDLGRPWTRGTVHQILINEKYIGNNVWNRISFKLKKRRTRNEPDTWVRAEGAFEAIVDKALFDAAQAIIGARSHRLSDDETRASFATSRGITRSSYRNSSGSRRWTCPSPDVLAKKGFGSREFARGPKMGTRTLIKRGDRGRRRTVGRIERGGGDDGEPVRSPPGRYWNRRPKHGSNFLAPSVRSGAPSVALDCWRHLVARPQPTRLPQRS